MKDDTSTHAVEFKQRKQGAVTHCQSDLRTPKHASLYVVRGQKTEVEVRHQCRLQRLQSQRDGYVLMGAVAKDEKVISWS